MAWEKHIVWDNKAQTKTHADAEDIAQPENADEGSVIYDEAEEQAKEEE